MAKDKTIDSTPDVFVVGEMVEWVEADGTIWDVKVLEVNGFNVIVEYGWDVAIFAPSAKGKHKLLIRGNHNVQDGEAEKDDYIRHPKKKDKKKDK
jgi:hypothetical protein